jgi:hypothetical protein
MKRHVFKWSVVLYIILLPYVCFSLSVPPADAPFFAAMLVLAACALLASEHETRRWRIMCVVGLVVAVLGLIVEIMAGYHIKSVLDKRRQPTAAVRPTSLTVLSLPVLATAN